MKNRREFFKTSFKVVAFGVSVGAFSKILSSDKKAYLRPPGADDKKHFYANCIRCGKCVIACPYNTLSLASVLDTPPNGTPFFEPRKTPCYLCEDIPCIKACPTDALDKKYLKEGVLNTKMGKAVVDDSSCVAYFGIQCDACYRACPLLDKALKLEYKRNERTNKHGKLIPVVVNEACVGCGKCERVCITDKPAIKVLDNELVLGKMGQNYIKGWDSDDESRLKGVDTKVKLDKNKAVDYLNDGDLF